MSSKADSSGDRRSQEIFTESYDSVQENAANNKVHVHSIRKYQCKHYKKVVLITMMVFVVSVLTLPLIPFYLGTKSLPNVNEVRSVYDSLCSIQYIQWHSSMNHLFCMG